ncbi:hypothetical protein L4X63_05440 [Geomonas sp. Red32]|uniref:hypothetical protein n=1 Tax=Geomonas sp. Red32 TaxID=2912856 RepID=UPI00202CED98|nr:hypothetical protein [Geomonas sp. Red32]MCM0081027.1 hypothetical protein [Geomonas sp. Red32]
MNRASDMRPVQDRHEPQGDTSHRYWHPVAPISELSPRVPGTALREPEPCTLSSGERRHRAPCASDHLLRR